MMTPDVVLPPLHIYGERWWSLFVYFLMMMSNNILWVTFSPISDIAGHYFGANTFYGSNPGINMMANMYLILYAPGMILAVIASKYLKPRKAILFSSIMTMFGALLRYMAAISKENLTPASLYWAMLLGQALASIAQPTLLNFPAALSGIWFPVHERDISTTIASMAAPIGAALGALIPVLFVSETNNGNANDDSNYDVNGMNELMLCEFLICLAAVSLAWIRFGDAPPTPPSQSTQLKLENKEFRDSAASLNAKSLQTIDPAVCIVNRESLMSESGMTSKYSADFDYRITTSDKPSFSLPAFLTSSLSQPPSELPSPPPPSTYSMPSSSVSKFDIPETSYGMVEREIKELFSNRDYVILFFVFSVVVGFFESVMTLLNQIISPYGYSNADAGTCSVVFIIAGTIGAAINGVVMKKTKAYRNILVVAMVCCFLASLFFVCMLFSDNYWPLMIAMAMIGMVNLPLIPIMMENCAEVTYPIPEEFSLGLMLTGSNVLGFFFIFALQYLLELEAFGPPPFLPSNVFIVAVLLVATLALLWYRGTLKRSLYEQPDHDDHHLHHGLLNPVHNEDA